MADWEVVSQTPLQPAAADWEVVSEAPTEYSEGLTGAREAAEDVMTRIANSVTFGLAAKGKAALQSALGEGEYDELLKRYRAENEAAGRRLGWGGAIASDLAGGLGAVSGLTRAGVTLAGRLPRTAGFIPRAAAGATEGAAYGAAYGAGNTDTGNAADYLRNAGEGALIGGAIGGGIPAAGAAIGVPAKYAASVLSGVSPESIALARQAGATGNRKFTEHLTGRADIIEPVEMTKRALSRLRDERSAAYRTGMEGVKADKSHLDFGPIVDAVEEAEKKVLHGGLPQSQEALETLTRIKALVNARRFQPQPGNAPGPARMVPAPEGPSLPTFGPARPNALPAPPRQMVPAPVTNAPHGPQISPHHTPEGFDKLKQAIGEIRMETKQGTLARNVADDIYNAAKEEIVEQAPAYAKTMQGYQKASEQLRELEQTFSTGERVSPDTTLRKLQSILRNDVSTNYGRRAKLGEVLSRYEPDLPYALAGQQMRPVIGRGMARYLGPIGVTAAGALSPGLLAALPLASPRAVSIGARASGALGPSVGRMSRPLVGLLGEDQRGGLLGR